MLDQAVVIKKNLIFKRLAVTSFVCFKNNT